VSYIWFNGGIKNTVRNWTPGPDYGGHSFKSYQDKISAELDAGFRGLSEDRDLIEYAESLHDFCRQGLNGFLVSDGYAHRCRMHKTKYYGFDGDYPQILASLENLLLSQGWALEKGLWRGLRASADEAAQNPAVTTIDQVPTFGEYHKGRLTLRIGLAEKATKQFLSLELHQKVDLPILGTYEVSRLQSTPEMIDRITHDHRYMIAIAIEGIYFENGK
jgi:hypothetical protein